MTEFSRYKKLAEVIAYLKCFDWLFVLLIPAIRSTTKDRKLNDDSPVKSRIPTAKYKSSNSRRANSE
jgi:hypothetical protein